MDDSNMSDANKKQARYPLGMSSFGQSCKQKKRVQFGQNVRLAMGCIEAPPEPVKGKAIPDDEASIRQRLKALSQEMSSQHADLLELLVKFDDLEGWKTGGARHCAAWMNFEIGISMQLSWEYLRVGRKLQLLPTLKALFRAGTLSWSKVRLISRVADRDSEPLLCHAALDASVSDVKRICETYRWGEDGNDGKNENDIQDENDRALKQWDSRSLTWSEASNGSTQIQLVLPPEIAQAFLNSVEQSMSQLGNTDSNMSQRRADHPYGYKAAVLMAETSLQSAGKAVATADRYQVLVSVDASDLTVAQSSLRSDNKRDNTSSGKSSNETIIPTKRPTVRGAGPIARETARRISCDCSLSINKSINGEPVDIGRKSRIWPNAMERAIKERDQHCVWPGCTQTRHLHIHHLDHWADGGTTSVDNGACLCALHHPLVHEGGYSIQRVDNNDQRLKEQFVQQQRTNDSRRFNFASSEIERVLCNSRDSFNEVRKLSPARYRFRVVDAQGKDILDQSNAGFSNAKNRPINQPHYSHQPRDSIRVECREPVPNDYYRGNNNANMPLQTPEALHCCTPVPRMGTCAQNGYIVDGK